MSVTSKLITLGAAGAGGGGLSLDDFFSVDLYTGTDSTQSINNGIDLADGGMVLIKNRNGDNNLFFDSTRGSTYRLKCPSSSSQTDLGEPAFNSSGFTLYGGSTPDYPNTNAVPYVSYSFKKSEGLFDIVTYTGDGVSGREIDHNLGVSPAFVLVKCTDAAFGWMAWSKYGAPSPAYQYTLFPDSTAAWTFYGVDFWGSSSSYTFNDSVFTVGSWGQVNQASNNYVAYLFADSDDGPIKCGTYSGNSSTQVIDCGFTSGARFVLIKALDTNSDWFIWDAERGIGAGDDPYIGLNLATSEYTNTDRLYYDASGFGLWNIFETNNSGTDYMYIAIGE